ncbi:MAG: ATP-binding cassette domain-containing protein, partial [Pedobacter sp.]
MNNIIQTTGLEYYHSKGVKTLTDINLKIEKGQIYGFLGPNGAGKTTTLRLLLGLLRLQHGKIEIFGQDFQAHRIEILKKVGSLIENPSLYGHLRANENLEVYREIYGASKERLKEVLEIVGLENTGNKKVKQFSLGMKQRLSVALALLPSPELLILDEPANGLDPTGIIELRELVKKLNKEAGMTIIMSSHQLTEIEKMVSYVGIISKGEMIFQGTLKELNDLQKNQNRLTIN